MLAWAASVVAMPFEIAWKVMVEMPTTACEALAHTAAGLLVRGRVTMSSPPKKRENAANGTPAVRAAKGKDRKSVV